MPELTAEFVIATGTSLRLEEARRAAELFLPDCEVTVTSAELPDGRLPSYWNETKELLEATARGRPGGVAPTWSWRRAAPTRTRTTG